MEEKAHTSVPSRFRRCAQYHSYARKKPETRFSKDGSEAFGNSDLCDFLTSAIYASFPYELVLSVNITQRISVNR